MDEENHVSCEPPDITTCKQSLCVEDDDKFKLECAECHRLVHYKCTILPTYQLQLFLTKGYRKYNCVNCVQIPKYLEELIPSPPMCQAKTMAEITTALNETSEESVENKVKNQALTNKNSQLCRETESLKEDLIQLKAENRDYENSLSVYEDNEKKLKSIIKNKEKELKEQQDKFDEAGNPDYEAVVQLESVMKRNLEQVGDSIKESLLMEVHENNKKVEVKFNEIMKENRSYAETLKTSRISDDNRSNSSSADFRTIIKENKNEELVQVLWRRHICMNFRYKKIRCDLARIIFLGVQSLISTSPF